MSSEHSKCTPMLIAIAVIAVAGIIGTAMYYCHQAVTSDYSFMRGEIDQLKKDVQELKASQTANLEISNP